MKGNPRYDIGLLVLRIGVGSVLLFYGAQKMLGIFGGDGFSKTVNHLGEMGIPPVFAILCICAEFFGSLGVLFGLLTPIAAFGVTCDMAVATYFVAKTPDAFKDLLSSGEPAKMAVLLYPFSLFLGAASIMIMGPGKYSFDAKFFIRGK